MTSESKGLIFLEAHHPIIEQTLLEKLAPGAKQEPCDVTCSDTDEVKYQIFVSPEARNIISFRLSMPYYNVLASAGASQEVSGIYGRYQASEKVKGYELVFHIDVDNLPEPFETIARNFALIKRNLLGAPFKRAFEALAADKPGSIKPVVIPYRVTEKIVLQPSSDRVNVFFTIKFQDEQDRALARVFLQEFAEAKRKIPQAPAVTFTTEMPGDLSKVKEFKPSKDLVGYVMFQMFKSHVANKEKLQRIVTLMQNFRGYLNYHITASKSHLHSRMRARVDLLLKVMRRADPHAGEETTKKAFRTYE